MTNVTQQTLSLNARTLLSIIQRGVSYVQGPNPQRLINVDFVHLEWAGTVTEREVALAELVAAGCVHVCDRLSECCYQVLP